LWLGVLGTVAVLWAGAAVHAGRTVFPIDLPIVEFLAHHRSSISTAAARTISTVASPVGLWLTVAVLAALARWPGGSWRSSGWQPALAAAATLGGIQLIDIAAKALVARPRPPLTLAVPGVSASGFAFPSGHTSQSTAIYGLIVVLLWRHYRKPAGRVAIAVLGVAAILSVGWARLYLGVHWFSDVLAAWLLGLSWLTVVLAAWTAWRIYHQNDDLPD
jgi:membrane-associated phospholipid phosphatase